MTRRKYIAMFITGAALAASGTYGLDLFVNFQPTGSTIPAGYMKDSGQNYGDQGGTSYGWRPVMTTIRVASGLVRPIFVTHAPADFDRAFIVEQRDGTTGRVRILDLATDTLLPTPFLSVSPVSTGGEQGLLGLAFPPDYSTSGYFYVNYTDAGGDTVIERYQVSADPDVADAGSGQLVLTLTQPYSNHNGGWMAFGLDGYLYVGLGDGGGGGDPLNNAQNLDDLHGKILRLDVSGDDFPADPARNYAIPPDNPFVGQGVRDETWAYGLRNPWRCDFDEANGDLWIADVGQSAWEEINVQPAASAGGENYGWRCYEGSHSYNTAGCSDPATMVFPIHEYAHAGGNCSITGGAVYRGSSIPELAGAYLFADYCTAQIWSLRYDGSSVTELIERTSELDPGAGLSINQVSSFGEDAAGELYICDLGGEVFKIISGNDLQ